jgi:hypothetical protein
MLGQSANPETWKAGILGLGSHAADRQVFRFPGRRRTASEPGIQAIGICTPRLLVDAPNASLLTTALACEKPHSRRWRRRIRGPGRFRSNRLLRLGRGTTPRR